MQLALDLLEDFVLELDEAVGDHVVEVRLLLLVNQGVDLLLRVHALLFFVHCELHLVQVLA